MKVFECILCDDSSPPHVIEDKVKGDLSGTLRAVQCRNCWHTQLSPPEYNLEFYEKDQQVNSVVSSYGTQMETIFEHSWIDARRRVARLDTQGAFALSGKQDFRLIDVGGGYGFFGAEVKRRFPSAEVLILEPSRSRIETGYAALKESDAALHLPTFQTGLLDEDFVAAHAECYDLVTLWHVVEHVPNPSALLRLALRLLKPATGRLCVEVPNFSDDLLDLSPAYRARHFMVEHVSYFTPQTLQAAALRAKPAAKISLNGYQRYGIFNYFHWLHFNAPQGARPDLYPGADRCWLETNWRSVKEATRTSDTLELVMW